MRAIENESSTAAAAASAPDARFGPWRREVGAFLELFALAGIAIAQPTLDIFQKNADYLLSRRTSVREAVIFVLVFILVPAAALWLAEVVVGLVASGARRWVHAVFIAVLAGVFVIEVLKKTTDLGAGVLVVAGLVLGVLVGIALLQLTALHTFLRYLSPAPIVFALIFLFSSAATPVIFVNDPSAAHVKVGRPSRVVMIVFDEFPMASLLDGTGKIDAALYPNFAALAGDATWYRNDTTVAPDTQVAVPAILTGRAPPGAQQPVPIASEYPKNIFTLLGGSYQMNVHESATRLCPPSLCPPPTTGPRANDGIGGLLDQAAEQWSKFASPHREAKDAALLQEDLRSQHAMDDARVFINSLQPASTPRLDFMHVLLPHSPWHYLGPGQDYVEKGSLGRREGIWPDAESISLGRERHLLQVKAADWMLGQVIGRLKRIGAYDSSMIVATSDHGVAFRADSPSRGVSEQNYAEIMWTPLFIKRPQQATGVVDDRSARSVDIVPTIADQLQVHIPWKVGGRSLFGPPRVDGPRPLAPWYVNVVKPAPGQKFLEFDGPKGFATAIKLRASAATGDPALRLYRVGEFGGLIGAPVAPLVAAGAAPPAATLDDADDFAYVRPDARTIPWAYAHGSVDVGPNQWVAVSVNGTVAAVGMTSTKRASGQAEFAAILPPQLMKAGANDVKLYVVSGTADSPRLTPTSLTRKE